jgi:DNA mismatch endonuclease (patch repair protein)
MSSPSYKQLRPASPEASRAARGASRKQDSKCEVVLRRLLWRKGCRFLKNVQTLPGKPDIVFPRARLAVFCDGDFWHGRDWQNRRARLQRGHNASYWVAKIRRNRDRDWLNMHRLLEDGWTVLRFWEKDILSSPEAIAHSIVEILDERGHRRRATGQPSSDGVK